MNCNGVSYRCGVMEIKGLNIIKGVLILLGGAFGSVTCGLTDRCLGKR